MNSKWAYIPEMSSRVQKNFSLITKLVSTFTFVLRYLNLFSLVVILLLI